MAASALAAVAAAVSLPSCQGGGASLRHHHHRHHHYRLNQACFPLSNPCFAIVASPSPSPSSLASSFCCSSSTSSSSSAASSSSLRALCLPPPSLSSSCVAKRRSFGSTSSSSSSSSRRRLLRPRAELRDPSGNNNDVQFSDHGDGAASKELIKNHVPLYVMLPLDTISEANTIKRTRALQAGFRALKIIGVDGVMVHVWWGIVERYMPESYDWSAYLALVKMISLAGLKVKVVMSFHGTQGIRDRFVVSLPSWVLSTAKSDPDIFHTDRVGNRYTSSLSLAVDSLPLFEGRSPVQIYKDFLASFRETFGSYIGSTIVEIVMSLGPNGELKYPSHPEGRWLFPGVGEFQCYDKYMLENLRNHAASVEMPQWGLGGPNDTPSYNQWPNDASFFQENRGLWNTPYGDFFLSWYAGELLRHGDTLLTTVSSIFKGDRVVIAGKVPAVHWWYKSRSHAAELTAGYYSTDERLWYEQVAKMFMKNGASMILPCMEMSDMEQPLEAKCSPELLLLQIRKACSKYGVPVSGENSLPRFDRTAHQRIRSNVHCFEYPYLPRLSAFCFLRMGEQLFFPENWNLFVGFVKTLDKGVQSGMRSINPWGKVGFLHTTGCESVLS